MRIYVTGGTGLVGSNVIKLARERYNMEVIASLYGPPPEHAVDYELDPLDMGDFEGIKNSIRNYKPDVVIHCAALLDQIMMFNQRKLSWSLMVDGTRAFALACREVGARLIFVSTDWVFDGMEPLVDEDFPPFPVNFYGLMKVAAERELSSMDGLNFGVGRLAGVYGINYALPSLLRKDQGLGFDLGNFVIDQLSQGKVAGIWMGPNVNDIAHPTLASDGSDMLLRLGLHNDNGIFHCFGSEYVSRLQFAHAYADVFGFDHSLIASIPTDPAVLAAHVNVRVPFRLRCSTEKTSMVLGRTSFNVMEGLEAFKKEWEATH